MVLGGQNPQESYDKKELSAASFSFIFVFCFLCLALLVLLFVCLFFIFYGVVEALTINEKSIFLKRSLQTSRREGEKNRRRARQHGVQWGHLGILFPLSALVAYANCCFFLFSLVL